MNRERGREGRGRWERKLENAKWIRSPDRNRDSNGDSYEDKDSDSDSDRQRLAQDIYTAAIFA